MPADVTPAKDDTPKTPPTADATHNGTSTNAADKGDTTAKPGADHQDAVKTAETEATKSFMDDIWGEWFKSSPTATSDKAATPTAATGDAAKTNDNASATSGTTAKASGDSGVCSVSGAPSDWSSINFDEAPSIYGLCSADSSKSNTTDASKLGQDPAAKSEPGFFDWAYDKVSGAASYVAEKADDLWDWTENLGKTTATAIQNDASNEHGKAEAVTGADGKISYFKTTTDTGTKILSDGGHQFTDSKGGTVYAGKNGEIYSQSADGSSIYTRNADKSQTYKTGDTEYTRTADGKYEMRDAEGHLTKVTNQGQITEINKMFSAAQYTTTVDAAGTSAVMGRLETFKDAQRTMDHDGNTFISRNNGVTEFTDKAGHHYRFDHIHHTKQIEENGKWRDLTAEERAKFHWRKGKHGGEEAQINGATIGDDGKVTTNEGVTIGQQETPGGKMIGTIPPVEGKGQAQITLNPDQTSVMELGGKATVVNPNDPHHLVTQYAEDRIGGFNPNDPNNVCLVTYDGTDNSMSFDDFSWDSNGEAHLNWADLDVSSEGIIHNADGSELFYSSPEKIESSSSKTAAACSTADAAVASVTSKIGTTTLTSGDVAVLGGALGGLQASFNEAMACGNFAAACEALAAQGDVYAAMGLAEQHKAAAENLRGLNMSESQIVGAAGDVTAMSASTLMDKMDADINGPNAVSAGGRLAYFSQHGRDISDEEAKRLTA